MKTDLTFFTNEPGSSLLDRFKKTLKDVRYFDILVGYFRTSGFFNLYQSLETIEKIRILVGLNIDQRAFEIIDVHRLQRNIDFESHKRTKETFTDNLTTEMDHSQDNYETELGVKKFIEFLQSGKMEIAYYEEFEKPKIVYAEIATEGKFLLDNKKHYSDTMTYIIADSSEYLLAILNSRLWTFLFSKVSSEISGGFFRWKKQYMELLPVFPATDKQKAPLINRVEKILADPNGSVVPRLEREIDELVYKLYGLTAEEIKIVEGKYQ